MYVTGSIGNLSARIHQLADSSGDFNTYRIEAIPYKNYLTVNEQIKITKEVNKIFNSIYDSDYTDDFFLDLSAYKPAIFIPPVIAGDTSTCSDLYCEVGTWTNDPTSYSFQWYRNSVPMEAIEGATGQTYRITNSDIGYSLECRVVASNAYGDSDPVASEQVGYVTEGSLTIYADIHNASNPEAGYTAVIGDLVEVTNLFVGGNNLTTTTYQWFRDNGMGGITEIPAATDSYYYPSFLDQFNQVFCVITLNNDCGSATYETTRISIS